MSYQVSHISDYFNSWAPFSTQAEYDNSGLLVGSQTSQVNGILTTLDVTQDVVDEAIAQGCNLIVAHHPLIFRKLSRISPDTSVGSILYKVIKNDLSILAVHTNLDAAQDGVSFVLADRLNLSQQEFLTHHDEEKRHGFGVVGYLTEPLSRASFLDYVCTKLGTTAVRHAGGSDLIHRVAVCGGSGISLAGDAVLKQADAFITADIKYHEFFDHPGLLKVDAGHYETEIHIAEHITRRLSDHFTNLTIITSSVRTNPMSIHHSTDHSNQPHNHQKPQ